MSVDDLGHPLQGGILNKIPSSASQADLIVGLNEIIDKLNSWNGVIMKADTVNVQNDGSARTVTTIPHGLRFAPQVAAFLNNVNISGPGDAINLTNVNIPLPSWLSISESGGNVVFPIYCNVYADDENVYIDIFNATGTPTSILPITYQLSRLNTNENS